MALQNGFVRGSSDNLPKVDVAMVVEFFREDVRFSASEIRGVKQASASREQYGDAAIGYVQLKRERSTCVVKAQVCPEHRVRGKAYDVTLIVEESKEKVAVLQCHDFASSEGGCKHAIALLMWVHRRSEEPSPTDVASYWVKPKLGACVSGKEYVTTVELGGCEPTTSQHPDNTMFLSKVLEGSKEEHSLLKKNVAKRPLLKEEELSLHYAGIQWMERHGNDKVNADIFSNFAKQFITNELICSAFTQSKGQVESPLWNELRYGRITASILHEASRCKKGVSLLNNILGGGSALITRAVARGKELEPLVLREVERKIGVKIDSCGIKLSAEHPLFGASPDGVTTDFIVEVKCPSKESTKVLYVKNGKITPKLEAQVQLQMHLMQINKALICIAGPNFESERGVQLMWADYNQALTNSLMCNALKFWDKFVLPKIITSCQ